MNIQKNEVLEIVDTDGKTIGLAARSVLHQDPSLLHPVAHVLVFNRKGELLLQLRSMNKDREPGKWDTSVGGHINPGEDTYTAALREMNEELGMTGCSLDYLYRYIYSDASESELVTTYICLYDGEVRFNEEEIDEARFWGLEEIRRNIDSDIFSRHFKKEVLAYLAHRHSE